MSYAEQELTAIVIDSANISYRCLCEKIETYRLSLKEAYPDKFTILMYGDYRISSIAFLWATLLENRVVMPVTSSNLQEYELARLVDAELIVDTDQLIFYSIAESSSSKEILNDLKNAHAAGLVLLSSGTTGRPKAVLHDANLLLRKYMRAKRRYRTLALMLFDHIAGIDTMFFTLCSGGTLVIPRSKSVDCIVEGISSNKVEVLPASPSLLYLLLLNSKFNINDLPTLKIITFGSERITDDLKERLQMRFGNELELIQKYGITEIGNPATVTNPEDPRYIKFKPDTVQYRIENDVLHLKTNGSLQGYLFESGFERHDGWFNTQDKVEVDGEWIKILGRVSDIINVGGQKVYPAEVESVLQSMEGVSSASVFGKANPIMGKIVAAKISLAKEESILSFKKRMREYCRGKLDSYKIPVEVEFVSEIKISDRFKKVRD